MENLLKHYYLLDLLLCFNYEKHIACIKGTLQINCTYTEKDSKLKNTNELDQYFIHPCPENIFLIECGTLHLSTNLCTKYSTEP